MTPVRVLLVTRNLPPLVGGMERLNWHLADELARRAELAVLVPTGSAAGLPRLAQACEVPLVPLWRFLLKAQWSALWLARKWRPQWVLAGSGLMALAVLLAARASGARAAVYVHGLDVAVRHPIYRAVWLRALARADRVIANSQATAALALGAGVPASRIRVLHPGVAVPAALPGPGQIAALRAELGLGARPLLLSVGRLSTRKGLREFVTEVLPRIAAVRPEVLLVVVGDAPVNALHAEAQSPDSIRAAAAAAGVAQNLRLIGTVTDLVKLGQLYAAASVHVFPVRQIPGDPEGFGMVAVEAAAYGLQTVAYDCGGIRDAVAQGCSGWLIPPGDAAGFADAVLTALARPLALEALCKHARRFAWPQFGESLWAVLMEPQDG